MLLIQTGVLVLAEPIGGNEGRTHMGVFVFAHNFQFTLKPGYYPAYNLAHEVTLNKAHAGSCYWKGETWGEKI